MIARILAFSVHRRWLVVLFTIAAAAIGAWSMLNLPIDAVPDITNNQVQINTIAPALSPSDVEKQVTYPLETALAGIPGLEYTRSLSRNGFSQITAVFSDRTDIYFARQQISERLTEAKESLPPGTKTRMGPVATGLGEIYMWVVHYKKTGEDTHFVDGKPGWQSDGSYLTPEGERLGTGLERTAYLRTVQDWIIRPQLRTVPGVAGIEAIGGFQKQYHVQPDPARLLGLGLSFGDVATAIENNNLSRAAGYLEDNGESYVVRSAGRLESMEKLGDVVIATRGGVPVQVKDIAEVKVGRELRMGSASENGQEAVLGTALMLIGSNSRTVSALVDAKMREVGKMLPRGIEVKTVLNRTILVDATIRTVSKNLAEGALLVFLILFLLFGNFRSALIILLVIPIVMLFTLAGMLQSKISANLMSLGALDFGLIVDGAVIITENSLRHLAKREQMTGQRLSREDRLTTVIKSAEEMIKPSVFGQMIIILVYLPLLTFSGIEGKMFEPMALTVIIALVSAFILSLTFVPAMIAIVMTGHIQENENRFFRWIRSGYGSALRRAIRSPLTIIGGAVAVLVAAAVLFSELGQEFIPTLDEKNIAMNVMRIPSTSLSQSQTMQLAIEETLSNLPQVGAVFSKTGTSDAATDPMPPNLSDTFIMLKPREEWPNPQLTKIELQQQINAALAPLAGNAFEFSQPIQMRFNELLAGVQGDVAVKVFGEDFGAMLRVANQIAAILSSTQGAEDIKVEQVTGLPFLDIDIDRSRIARLGLSISAVQDEIGAAIGGRHAGVVFEGDRRFPIIVRLNDDVRESLESLKNLPVPLAAMKQTDSAPAILLKQVARFQLTEGPNQISRENCNRRVVVTANVRGRDIGSLVAEVQEKVADFIQVPAGYWLSWGGQFENLASARQRLSIVVPACFFMIFLLLYTALGSPRDALLVFSGVPLAISGGIAALWIRGMPFSVSAAVGFIALSGVAVLNGLVMLTSIKQLIDQGTPVLPAVYEGALTRLRPVAMTALVASLGFVPMALATGTGAEVQKPLATVVIGGLISATMLTLLVLPALYVRFRQRGPKAKVFDLATPLPHGSAVSD